MTTDYRIAMDGFNKTQALTEGYLRKGGQNATSQIVERPPAPGAIRSASAPDQPKKTESDGVK